MNSVLTDSHNIPSLLSHFPIVVTLAVLDAVKDNILGLLLTN